MFKSFTFRTELTGKRRSRQKTEENVESSEQYSVPLLSRQRLTSRRVHSSDIYRKNLKSRARDKTVNKTFVTWFMCFISFLNSIADRDFYHEKEKKDSQKNLIFCWWSKRFAGMKKGTVQKKKAERKVSQFPLPRVCNEVSSTSAFL